MEIKIFDVNSNRNPEACEADRMRYECVLFQVLKDCNTRFYMVTNDTYEDEDASNTTRRTYWFPSCDVKKGDVLQLWTKSGKFSITPLLNGDEDGVVKDTHWHNFYWGQSQCIWNKDKARVTLMKMQLIEVVSVDSY